MKVSVVVPVHNEDEDVGECLDALIEQDYRLDDYEIVAVDDGSTDNTFDVLLDKQVEAERNGIPLRLVKLGKRKGRFLARKNGAKASRYENLLFVDSRVIPDKQLLKRLMELNHQPIVGNVVMLPNRSVFDHFFHLIRRRLYSPYYGEEFQHVYITEENFSSRIPKGTGIFFCEKNLFLEATEEIGDKRDLIISDDTKLLHSVARKKSILKHSTPRVYYKTRLGLKSNFTHMLNRGKKFSDFYLSKGGSFRKYFGLGLPLIYFTLLVGLFFPTMTLLAAVIAVAIFEVGLAKTFCRSWTDLKIFIPFSMLFGFAFSLGILRVKLKILTLVVLMVAASYVALSRLMV